MAPRSNEQFKKIRTNRKAKIIETALELFATNGFHGTSISMIAKKAEISKGLMYNYFSSKEELIQVIIFAGIDELMKNFDSNKDGILTKEDLIFFINENFRILKENEIYWKLYFSVLMQPTVLSLVEMQLMALLQSMIKILENYFEHQGAENPEVEAAFFVSMLDGVSMYYILNIENFPVEAIKQKILKMYK